MKLQPMTKAKLIIAGGSLVTLGVYGCVVVYLIAAVNRGATDNQMALLAVIGALLISATMIATQQLLTFWQRLRIRRLDRRFESLR